MTPKLQAFLIVFWSTIAGLLVVAMVGTLLYRIDQGSYVLPAALEVQLINTLVIVLAAVGPFVVGWMNRKRSDQNNQKTLDAVGEVTYILKNGLKTAIAQETATLVNENALVVADKLAETVVQTAQSLAGARAETHQVANTAALVANTAATDQNTEARHA